MAVNVLEYLEQSAARFPDRTAFEDKSGSLSYSETVKNAKQTGTALARGCRDICRPVMVYMDKTAGSIAMFLGVLYSGNFYCPLDSDMPEARIRLILETAEPEAVITDRAHRSEVEAFAPDTQIYLFEDLLNEEIDEELLRRRISLITEEDPVFMLFTSGSTGVPKGAVTSHRTLINYLEWLGSKAEEFNLNENTVFGNQAPLYFIISVHDIYGAVYFGAKTVIIPHSLFSFPVKLIEYINEKRVSSILWVASAMSIIATFRTFRERLPEYLKTVMFVGEVLPRKHLNYWRKNLPEVLFVNWYGSTETIAMAVHVCTGKEPVGEPVPIGYAIQSVRTYVLNENGNEVPEGETGELCVSGSCLSPGYYNNPEKTAEAFVQNPMQTAYPERMYRTGDLVYKDQNGELNFVARRDFQIKYMGYRIEPGEIEAAAYQIDGIHDCAAVFDSRRRRVVLCYAGDEIDTGKLKACLAKRLPEYMLPRQYLYLDRLPHNSNGKIDRRKLMNEL